MCNSTVNTIMPLSLFSASTAAIMSIVTIPTAGIIVLTIINNSKRRCKGLFYKLLLNIAIADLLTGIIVDVASMNFHIKEALRVRISDLDTYCLHVPLFVTDAVALVTTAILSADRIIALIKPFRYRQGLPPLPKHALTILPWPVAILIAVPYFYVGFIRQLALFALFAILLPVASLFSTLIIYKYKQREPCKCSALQFCERRRKQFYRSVDHSTVNTTQSNIDIKDKDSKQSTIKEEKETIYYNGLLPPSRRHEEESTHTKSLIDLPKNKFFITRNFGKLRSGGAK